MGHYVYSFFQFLNSSRSFVKPLELKLEGCTSITSQSFDLKLMCGGVQRLIADYENTVTVPC